MHKPGLITRPPTQEHLLRRNLRSWGVALVVIAMVAAVLPPQAFMSPVAQPPRSPAPRAAATPPQRMALKPKLAVSTWAVTLAESSSTVTTTTKSTLTATANQPVDGTGFVIDIVDTTANVVNTYCSTGSICTYQVGLSSVGSHNYVAYIAANTTLPLSNIQATSNQQNVALAPLSIALTSSATTITTSTSASLTATSNQSVTGSPYAIYIVDTTTNTNLTLCTTGSICIFDMRLNSVGVHKVVAYISTYDGNYVPTTGIQATSNVLSMALQAFAISLTSNAATVAPNGTVSLTATANQLIDGTPYAIYIVDTTTNANLTLCTTGSTCAVNTTLASVGPHTDVAYVSPYNGNYVPATGAPVAQSGSYILSQQAWNISMTASTTQPTRTGTTALVATASQSVTGSPYAIYIVDTTTNTNLTLCTTGSTCVVDATISDVKTHTMIAYVSPYNGNYVPTSGIVTNSGPVSITLLPYAVTLTATPSNPNGGQTTALVAQVNQPVTGGPYAIYIVDTTTNTNLTLCATGSTCSVNYAPTAVGVHYIMAYVSPYNGNYVPAAGTPVADSGNALAIAVHSFQVDLTGPTAPVSTGSSAVLQAITNQTVTGSVYAIYIVDTTTNTNLALCTSGSSCSATMRPLVAGTHNIMAYVSTYNGNYVPTSGIVATSTPGVAVTAQNYTLTLNTAPGTSSNTVALTAIANQTVNNTNYAIYIVDTTTNTNLALCTSGSTCSTVTAANGDNFVAYISPYNGNYVPSSGIATQSGVAGSPNTTGPTYTGAYTGSTNPSIPAKHCTCKDPVDTASGAFVETAHDLAIPGRGPLLDLSRSYDNQAGSTSPYGYNWTDNYNMSITPDPIAANQMDVSQENGSVDQFTQDSSGNWVAPSWVLATLVQNLDGTWTFTRRQQQVYQFSSTGQLTAIQDLNGYTTTLTYNSSGQLSTVTDPAGRYISFTWTGPNITKAVDSTGRQVLYSYSGAGDLASVTDTGGAITSYTYDGYHQILTITTADHGVVTNTYDTSERVVSQIDPLNRKTSFAYSTSGASHVTTVTDAMGVVYTTTYTNNILVSSVAGSGTPQAATTTYNYDPNTLGTSTTTDPLGHISTATYNSQGYPLSKTDPLGHTTRYTYDNLGDVLTITDPIGTTTTNTYDTHGNLLSTSTPLAGTTQTRTTTYTHGDVTRVGDVTMITDPDGNNWTYTYDSYGDQSSATDPLGGKATIIYNALGQKTTMVAPKGNVSGGSPASYTTSYSYDAWGHLISTTDPLGHTTSQVYDNVGNRNSSTDANGHKTAWTYDLDHEVTVETAADNSTQSWTYDANGRKTSWTNGAGAKTVYGYDTVGNQNKIVDPLNRTTSSNYDLANNQTSKIDPANRTTTYAYNSDNQLLKVSYSDGSTPNSSYSYDADGRRVGMVDGTGSSNWTYDSLGRLTGTTNGAGKIVGYGYDLAGRQTSLVYPDGHTVSQTFDTAGRMTGVQDWMGHTTTYSYDANGNPVGTAYPNTITGAIGYNNADQSSNIAYTTPGSLGVGTSTVASMAYTRDGNGQVLSENDTGLPGSGSQSYTYTPKNQLASDSNGGYGYDPANNLTAKPTAATQGFDSASQLCWTGSGSGSCSAPPVGATTYGYDSQGNRVKATPVAGTASSYSWNQANQLTGASTPAGSGSYTYDGTGLRASKTVGGVVGQFTWSQSGRVPLLLVDGVVNYVYGPNGAPLEQVSGSTVLYYQQDQLGSTRLLTSSTGVVVGSWTYTSYGAVTASTGSASNPLLYGGQYQDIESGLYYLRARYYDPTTGQFLSVDPLVGLTGSPYGYVGDSPLNGSDYGGLSWYNPASWSGHTWEVVGGVALGVAAAATGVGAVVEAGAAAGAAEGALTAALTTSAEYGAASLVTGAGAVALDAKDCLSAHNDIACVGFGLGGAALLAGGAGEIGTLGLLYEWITAETIPDAALQSLGAFGASLGIGGVLLDSVYGLNQLLLGRHSCAS